MLPRPVALPRSPRRQPAAGTGGKAAATASPDINAMLRRREAVARQLERLDAQITDIRFHTICDGRDDSQDVELYDGQLEVSREFVDQHEPPIGQLQWLEEVTKCFRDDGRKPGNVAGVRWGSGCLISDDLFLTAAHCFDQISGGRTRPTRHGQPLEPHETARLMQVNFNYQVDAEARRAGKVPDVRPGVSFFVAELLEYGFDEGGDVDYAIVRLSPNADGVLPGKLFGHLRPAPQDLTNQGAMLCVIQHPDGAPKRIEAGPMHENRNGRISYKDIDTRGASSGSPILSEAGKVVGVHTNGGCTKDGGYNSGVSIGRIREVSAVIEGLAIL